MDLEIVKAAPHAQPHDPIVMLLTYIDSFGVATWDLRYVAAASAIILLTMRAVIGKYRNVGIHNLLHASVTGLGALSCVYYDMTRYGGFKPKMLSSFYHWLGPLTGLHRILPAVTLGYAVVDILEGLSTSTAFLLHGIATGLVMTYTIYFDVSHVIYPTLLMEVSSIGLELVRGEMPKKAKAVIILYFIFTFFFFRLLFIPAYISYGYYLMNVAPFEYPTGLPSHFTYFIVGFGIFFTALNIFWFYKILEKAIATQRKNQAKSGKKE